MMYSFWLRLILRLVFFIAIVYKITNSKIIERERERERV